MKKEIVIDSVSLIPGEEFLLTTRHVSKRNKVPALTEFTEKYYSLTCGPHGGLYLKVDR